MSNSKKVIVKLGNFEVVQDKSAVYNYIRIRAIGGHWSVAYRDDSPMYGKILLMAKKEEYNEALERTIIFLYNFTNMLVDREFVNDFSKAVFAMQERIAKLQAELTEEENEVAIREAAVMEQAREILTKKE